MGRGLLSGVDQLSGPPSVARGMAAHGQELELPNYGWSFLNP